MTPPHRHQHLTFLVALFVFVAGMLGSTAFTLWRLHADAIVSGLEITELHGRVFEELLTQNLRTIEVVAANVVEQEVRLPAVGKSGNPFSALLARAPFMRSMSILDERGRVIASSNPANLGLVTSTESYLPLGDGKPGALRIGTPWSGRDFADGSAAEDGAANIAETPAFVPVSQTIHSLARTLTG